MWFRHEGDLILRPVIALHVPFDSVAQFRDVDIERILVLRRILEAVQPDFETVEDGHKEPSEGTAEVMFGT